ncbi:MAG: acyl-CoA synthetase [Gammaproteobacteria bacterium]
MTKLTEINDYAASHAAYSPAALWALFDGNRDRLNIAHECLDRHRARGRAVTVKFASGRLEHYGFGELADLANQFAHYLARQGVAPGARVAVILEPGRAFYTCVFGALKRGAVAVPLFTLFGPEGLALRVHDCRPEVIVTDGPEGPLRVQFPQIRVIKIDAEFWAALAAEDPQYNPVTRADDLALFQYTSGTTRELPAAVKHSHRAVVTVMIAALYGVGLRPGDRYFCPSSPAWGHGLWHGTVSPLALGIPICAYAGKFDPKRIFEVLEDLSVDNFSAAATVYRMLRNSALRERYRVHLRKCTFTGEPLDSATFEWIVDAFGLAPGSMYGSTEVGCIIVDYPGMTGHRIKRGALGRPAPGAEIAVLDATGATVAPGVIGELAVQRRGAWFRIKDSGWRDEDGYLFHAGRADDVIISAGWTMSAVEIENTLLKHPEILEAAVIGIADPVRGQVAKAYLVARHASPPDAIALQQYMKDRLSQHEYPRAIEFVSELPKTPAGKINRQALRARAKLQSEIEP